MVENPHYKKLLQLLNEFEVEYLIAGGFAAMKYGEPRYTKGLEVWVHNSPHNSVRVVGALKKLGAPAEHDGITAETFTEKRQQHRPDGRSRQRVDSEWSAFCPR
jgi:hypothetical protein